MTAPDPVVAALRSVLPPGAVLDDPDVVPSYAVPSYARDWLAREIGPVGLRVHRDVKAALDALGILDPDRMSG